MKLSIQRSAVLAAMICLSALSALHAEEPAGKRAQGGGETRRESETTVQVYLRAGGTDFTIALERNPTTEALLARLPLSVTMTEFNGNEKYYNLPVTLPIDAQPVTSVRAGDVVLYGNNCLVIFYESFQTSQRYTRLGHVENTAGLKEAFGSGNVRVTLSLP